MENHPIPQDITSFQFKLIGEMTIKQFFYLAAGSVLAWILLLIDIVGIIKFPMSLAAFMTGFSLAFIPITGRPLDTMLSLFIKALFVPNQYVYRKEAGQIAILHISPRRITKPKFIKTSSYEKLQRALQLSGSARTKNKLDEKEMVFFQSLATLYSPPIQNSAAYTSPVTNQPSIPETKPNTTPKEESSRQTEIIENEEEILRKQTDRITKELEATRVQEMLQKEIKNSQEAHEQVTELEKQLQYAFLEKQRLEKQLEMLAQRLNNPGQKIFSPSMANPPKTQNVRVVPKIMSRQTGVPIVPEIPNILSGVIKDARGNILINILVEVKDKDGNPVRAFKTNSLGQFSSATPLLNGTYAIEFEDPLGKQKFDKIQLVAKGEIIPPMEVFSTDDRETLRQELFKT